MATELSGSQLACHLTGGDASYDIFTYPRAPSGEPFPPYDDPMAALGEDSSEFAKWIPHTRPDPLFDFQNYLKMFDITQNYEIESLGGITNITARAIKKPPPKANKKGKGRAIVQKALVWAKLDEFHMRSGGSFPDHCSVIIKYFPPFAAGRGRGFPMSQGRQQVEAKALALFGPGCRLGKIAEQSSILIPQLIRPDIHSHILITSDLGDILTLQEILRSFKTLNGERDSLYLQTTFTQIGQSIGLFFANLHATETISRIGDHDLTEFLNPRSKIQLHLVKINPMMRYMELALVQDYAELYRRIEYEFLNEDRIAGKRVFAFGDPSTVSFLVQPFPRKIGLIGWQYAGPGRGLNGDIAKIFASIRAWVYGGYDEQNATYIAGAALLDGMASSYRQQSRQNVAEWSVEWYGNPGHWGMLHLPRDTMSVLRSAFIVYGANMIEAAMTLFELCDCKVNSYNDGCAIRRDIVAEGAWHVEVGGQDTAVFESNWEAICEHGSVLLDLVLGD